MAMSKASPAGTGMKTSAGGTQLIPRTEAATLAEVSVLQADAARHAALPRHVPCPEAEERTGAEPAVSVLRQPGIPQLCC